MSKDTEIQILIPHIRIEGEGLISKDTHVYFRDRNGEQTDISACVQAYTVTGRVGELTTATLEVIAVAGNVSADLTTVITNHLWAYRFPRLTHLWWRIRRPRRTSRYREVTGHGETWKRHTPR